MTGAAARERGSGTVIAVVLIAVVLATGMVLGAATFRLALKSHIQGVADIGAIAAARAGTCAAAHEVAGRNPRPGQELSRCEYTAGFAQVEVRWTGTTTVTVTARAGPDW